MTSNPLRTTTSPLKTFITLILLSLPVAGGAFGQVRTPAVVNAGGTTVQGDAGQHSFSIGEIGIITIGSNEGQVTQGFLQPEAPAAGEGFDYYPNPVVTDLYLVNARFVKSIRVFDLSGREVLRTPYTGKPISLEALSGATYLINTYTADGKPFVKFNIIKQ
jgi:hypothetical protein